MAELSSHCRSLLDSVQKTLLTLKLTRSLSSSSSTFTLQVFTFFKSSSLQVFKSSAFGFVVCLLKKREKFIGGEKREEGGENRCVVQQLQQEDPSFRLCALGALFGGLGQKGEERNGWKIPKHIKRDLWVEQDDGKEERVVRACGWRSGPIREIGTRPALSTRLPSSACCEGCPSRKTGEG